MRVWILPQCPAGVGKSIALTASEPSSQPNLVFNAFGVSRLGDLLTLENDRSLPKFFNEL